MCVLTWMLKTSFHSAISRRKLHRRQKSDNPLIQSETAEITGEYKNKALGLQPLHCPFHTSFVQQTQ